MKFLRYFNRLARRERSVTVTSALSGDNAEVQGAPATNVTQYYMDASRILREAVSELGKTLVLGEIIVEPDKRDPRMTRIITRFPPDDSPNPPKAGFIMEIFDVRACEPIKNLQPTYEIDRWEIDNIYLPETVDGTFEGAKIHNLGQIVGTVLRRSERLQFIDDTPPAVRGFAIAGQFRIA